LHREGMETKQIQLRKAYWDTDIDWTLAEDPVALNLLYIEAKEDIKAKNIVVTDEAKVSLAAHQKAGLKKEFVERCSELKGYGRWRWPDCTSSFPKAGTSVEVRIGANELLLTVEDGQEQAFRVSRMRCWRVGTADDGSSLELSFHFLKGKDDLIWIKIQSQHAILMSMSLTSVVDELISIKQNRPMRKPADREQRAKSREVRASKPLVEKPTGLVLKMEAEAAATAAADAAAAAAAAQEAYKAAGGMDDVGIGDGDGGGGSDGAAVAKAPTTLATAVTAEGGGGKKKAKKKGASSAPNPVFGAFGFDEEANNSTVFGDIDDADL